MRDGSIGSRKNKISEETKSNVKILATDVVI